MDKNDGVISAPLQRLVIPHGGFRTIVADPPWQVKCLESPGSRAFGTQDGILRSIPLKYPTMTIDQIAALPVSDLASKDSHLYLWTINAYIEHAYIVVRAWGFHPATFLTWCKAPMGQGHGGTFCNTTEFVLFARRGTLKAKRRVDRTWWQWKRGRIHSKKPEEFQDMVETVSPGPYIELFARRYRLGWTVWGNEV